MYNIENIDTISPKQPSALFHRQTTEHKIQNRHGQHLRPQPHTLILSVISVPFIQRTIIGTKPWQDENNHKKLEGKCCMCVCVRQRRGRHSKVSKRKTSHPLCTYSFSCQTSNYGHVLSQWLWITKSADEFWNRQKVKEEKLN